MGKRDRADEVAKLEVRSRSRRARRDLQIRWQFFPPAAHNGFHDVKNSLLLLLVMTAVAAADEPKLMFEQHIAPILAARCAKCHGDGKLEAGLDVRRKSLLAKGGDSGPALMRRQAG